jgi:cytochrome c6
MGIVAEGWRKRALFGLFAATFTLGGNPAWTADILRGRQIYLQHCAVCHGPDGMGVMPGAPNFARNERLFQPDAMLVASIRSGKNAMPPFIGILNEREMYDVVAYLRTLR